MKRSFATATGVVVLLASAVGAQATANVDSGTYKGRTNKHNRVTFKVTAGKSLVHFTHKGLRFHCSDGTHFTINDKLDSGGGRKNRVTILDDGRFGFTV